MNKFNYSVILGNVGSCCDRFMTCSYSDSFTVEQLFQRVASIKAVSRVTGVELVTNWHVNEKNAKHVKELLDRYELKLVSIIPDQFAQRKWGKGAFTSKDSSIRRMAVEEVKEIIDYASELGCKLISLWPGQDGYDYYFTADYAQERTWFEECLKECCDYKKDTRISVEYKPKEPRIRSYPSNVYATLLMVKETGKENCGITIDYGHALVAYENVAESVLVLKKYGDKLFHIHMNDCYGYWDDDMIVGSVHTIQYLEMFYWMKKTGYQGYISSDQYPYREDGRDAVAQTIAWMECFEDIADKMLDDKEVDQVIRSGDTVAAAAMLRRIMFQK